MKDADRRVTKDKFGSIPSRDSDSVCSKISTGEKQSKVIEPEMNIAKINDGKKTSQKNCTDERTSR